jgi:hypothetical protein
MTVVTCTRWHAVTPAGAAPSSTVGPADTGDGARGVVDTSADGTSAPVSPEGSSATSADRIVATSGTMLVAATCAAIAALASL